MNVVLFGVDEAGGMAERQDLVVNSANEALSVAKVFLEKNPDLVEVIAVQCYVEMNRQQSICGSAFHVLFLGIVYGPLEAKVPETPDEKALLKAYLRGLLKRVDE